MTANRIAIAACSLVIIAGPGHWREAAAEPQSSASASDVRSRHKDSNVRVEYTVVNSGEIETSYGVPLGFTNFKSSDGVGLTVFYLVRNDAVRAVQAFNEDLARAATAIERSAKKDSNGNVLGERAQILLPSTIPIPPFPAVAGPQLPAVVWTDGQTFHEITSSSLQKVLELEKVYRY
jgi:hypothetical protein